MSFFIQNRRFSIYVSVCFSMHRRYLKDACATVNNDYCWEWEWEDQKDKGPFEFYSVDLCYNLNVFNSQCLFFIIKTLFTWTYKGVK